MKGKISKSILYAAIVGMVFLSIASWEIFSIALNKSAPQILSRDNLPEGIEIKDDWRIKAVNGYHLSRIGNTRSFIVYQKSAPGRSLRLVGTTPLTCGCFSIPTTDTPCPDCPIVEPNSGCEAKIDGIYIRCQKRTCNKKCAWMR